MKCEFCCEEVSEERLEVLPDTNLCVRCSEDNGPDYDLFIVEENLGSSIVSKPMIFKIRNVTL